MNTAIPAERLRDLRLTARAQPRPRFPDPTPIHKVGEVLFRRGETWAMEVLGHSLDRRSLISAKQPWLEDHEVPLLLLADIEEDRVRFDAIVKEPS